MDAIRNPYSPGAGRRPPELAGRESELDRFEVLLGRLEVGSSDRGLMLAGLRGVGKTVLLNELPGEVRTAQLDRCEGRGRWRAFVPDARSR